MVLLFQLCTSPFSVGDVAEWSEVDSMVWLMEEAFEFQQVLCY